MLDDEIKRQYVEMRTGRKLNEQTIGDLSGNQDNKHYLTREQIIDEVNNGKNTWSDEDLMILNYHWNQNWETITYSNFEKLMFKAVGKRPMSVRGAIKTHHLSKRKKLINAKKEEQRRQEQLS
jgi:hypothetical protein